MKTMLKTLLTVGFGVALLAGCWSRESEFRSLLDKNGYSKDQIETAVENFRQDTPERQAQKIKIIKAMGGLMALGAAANMSEEDGAKACVSNLRQMEAAVLACRMVGQYDGTFKSIVGEKSYIKKMPKCPRGGTYKLPSKNDDDGVPTCSVGGTHSL